MFKLDMVLLLAQLVAPPVQRGPVRLPAPVRPSEPGAGGEIPTIKGSTPYDRRQLLQVLGPCSAIADPAERLRSCAAALTARLVADGFLNSRIRGSLRP